MSRSNSVTVQLLTSNLDMKSAFRWSKLLRNCYRINLQFPLPDPRCVLCRCCPPCQTFDPLLIIIQQADELKHSLLKPLKRTWVVTIQSAASTALLAACESDSVTNLDHREAIFMSKLLVTGQELNSNPGSVVLADN